MLLLSPFLFLLLTDTTGKPKAMFYKVPPKECFVEARRYPEFAIYLSEGVQTGRYSQVTPGPQNKTVPLRDANLIQDVATEIVQRIYNISKQVEESKKESITFTILTSLSFSCQYYAIFNSYILHLFKPICCL